MNTHRLFQAILLAILYFARYQIRLSEFEIWEKGLERQQFQA